MDKSQNAIEVQGSSVEEAIEAGLKQLGLQRSDVNVEVLEEASRGLLGIGSRPASVRLTEVSAVDITPVKEATVSPKPEAADLDSAAEEVVESVPDPAIAVVVDEPDEAADDDTPGEVIKELLDKLGVEASISSRLSEPDDRSGKQINIYEVSGDDLGILIGPRGETLNSIQYVSRLIASHKMRRRADFVLDVEGYRAKREIALARLAERMANKVRDRDRPIALEPMPPHERRIIHMTLRDSDNVYTQSVGEGNRRKVRIIPK